MELHSRKGGKSGSVSYILNEAERLDGACPHVPNPAPPELLWGMDVAQLRQLHDARAEAGQVAHGGKLRAIRKDQNTLFSVVLSFPGEMATADPEAVRDWERRSTAWLCKEFGDRLKSIIRHTDEGYPHLHAYGLADEPDMKVASLHPGYAAKAEALASGDDNRGGDRAYKDAMRAWQDRYWQDVGLPCGQTRLGPGKRRLSRQQWHAEKSAHRAVRTAIKADSHMRAKGAAFVEKTKAGAAEIVMAAKAEAVEIATAAKVQADAVKADARRTWYQVRQEAEMARRASEEAQRALAKVEGYASRLATLWTALRGFVSGHDRKIEERVREDEAAKRRPIEDGLNVSRSALREEQQRNRNLSDSLQELASSLRESRRELDRLRPDPVRPSRDLGRSI